MDYFAQVARQRRAIADRLEGFSDEQWRAQSLCGAWSVHDLLAHLVMPLEISPVRAIGAIARARGNFDVANRRLTAQFSSLDNHELITKLRRNAESHFTPPGHDSNAPLAENYIHARDIFDPLQRSAPGELDDWQTVATFLSTKRARRGFVPKALPPLTFTATDSTFRAGSGDQVTGTTADLAMAMAGRTTAPGSFGGPGADALHQWVAAQRHN
jgi:uncharacterized protein (TIGR03083 family)